MVLLLPWKPWATDESLEPPTITSPTIKDGLTILIPARNEEATIKEVVTAAKGQGKDIYIIVVDDCSNDNTADIAQEALGDSGHVVSGTPPPSGWSGKLWALEQGLWHVKTPMVLLLDADILLKEGIVATAREFMEKNQLDFLSLMAELRMTNAWERLFMPAFVYFFKLLYPFALSNRHGHFIAAAAGGFILTKTKVLKHVGAFEAIRQALIDDCALASRVKRAGFRTWIGLTRSVVSLRRYQGLGKIWHMVERTAFTQLRHSWLLLFLTTIVMSVMFIWPVAGILSSNWKMVVPCLAALSFMCITYLPTLRYYNQPAILAPTLPLVATLYMAMTWSSAMRFATGKGACWKERKY